MDSRFRKLFSFITVGVLLLMFFSSILKPAFATGSSAPEICQLTTVIMNVFNMIIAAFPIIGLAILMFGAFMWATASADPQKLEAAKKTLTYGVIGLIAGLSSIVILATLESMLISENFTLFSEKGVLRVDFCLEEYKADGSTSGTDDGGTIPVRTCEERGLTTCDDDCCESWESCAYISSTKSMECINKENPPALECAPPAVVCGSTCCEEVPGYRVCRNDVCTTLR